MPAKPTLSIRPATPADVPLVLSLIRELAEYERAPNDVDATESLVHQALFGSAPGPGCIDAPNHPRGPIAECIIGEVDGQPQGFAVYFHNFSTWKGRPGMYLEDLFVRPSARGVGLGKALFLRVAQIAKDRGCPRFEWSVLDWNTPAIDFYVSMGARPMTGWTVYRMDAAALKALG